MRISNFKSSLFKWILLGLLGWLLIHSVGCNGCSEIKDFHEMADEEITLHQPKDRLFIPDSQFNGEDPTGVLLTWEEPNCLPDNKPCSEYPIDPIEYVLYLNGKFGGEEDGIFRKLVLPLKGDLREREFTISNESAAKELKPTETPFSWLIRTQNNFQTNYSPIRSFYVYPEKIIPIEPIGTICPEELITFSWEYIILGKRTTVTISTDETFQDPDQEAFSLQVDNPIISFDLPISRLDVSKNYFWKVESILQDESITIYSDVVNFKFHQFISPEIISPNIGSCKIEPTYIWTPVSTAEKIELYLIKTEEVDGEDVEKEYLLTTFEGEEAKTAERFVLTLSRQEELELQYCNDLYKFRVVAYANECTAGPNGGKFVDEQQYIFGFEYGDWIYLDGGRINSGSVHVENNPLSEDYLIITEEEDANLAGLYIGYIEMTPRGSSQGEVRERLVKYDETNDAWIPIINDDFSFFAVTSQSLVRNIALTYGNGKIYFAWTEQDDTVTSNNVFMHSMFVRSYDGTTWSPLIGGGRANVDLYNATALDPFDLTTQNDDWTTQSPDIAIYNGEIYVSFVSVMGETETYNSKTGWWYYLSVMKYDESTSLWVAVGCNPLNFPSNSVNPYPDYGVSSTTLKVHNGTLYLAFGSQFNISIYKLDTGNNTWQPVINTNDPGSNSSSYNNYADFTIAEEGAGTYKFYIAVGSSRVYSARTALNASTWQYYGGKEVFLDLDIESTEKTPTIWVEEGVPYLGWTQPDNASVYSTRVKFWNESCGEWDQLGSSPNESLEYAAQTPRVFFYKNFDPEIKEERIPYVLFAQFDSKGATDLYVKYYKCLE